MATYYVTTSGSDSAAGTSQVLAWATLSHALATAASGDTINLQSGTYTQTSALTYTQATLTIIGYQTTPGDFGTPPVITTATSTVDLMSTSSNNGRQCWINCSFTNTASSKGNGIIQTTQHGTDQWWTFFHCYFSGFTAAVNADNSGSHYDVGFIQLVDCEVTACVGANPSDMYVLIGATTRFDIIGCNIHDNASSVGQLIFFNGGYGLIEDTLITDNVVTAQVIWQGGSCNYIRLKNCTIANNGGGTSLDMRNMGLVYNCLFWGNYRAIIADTTNDAIAANAASRNNAFGSNANANTNWTAGTFDQTLTINPFVNSSARNYALNSIVGGGLSCTGTGFPGPTFKSGVTINSINIGAMQGGVGLGGSLNASYFY